MEYPFNTVVELDNKMYIAREGIKHSCEGCVFDSADYTDPDSACYKLNMQGNGCENIIWKPLLKDEKPVQSSDKQEYDTVSKPKHYMLFEDKNIEVRDLMKLLADRLESKGYSAMLISDYVQLMQYLLRFDQKNALEDLKKGAWYLEKIIETLS